VTGEDPWVRHVRPVDRVCEVLGKEHGLVKTDQFGRAGDPAVVVGDFNVCPSDLDVYDPSAFVGATHVTPPERERFQAVLDAGTVDAFRQLHPEEPGFTWWDYRQGHFHRKMGLRIDAFLLSHPLAADLIECGIDRSFRKGSRPSDHAPLLCTLAR
jgi:exodeoxyribonuclease III